ncbi:UDP-N-acetylmuramate:L-alanyl-gamma-D-glutamyl-meso-diaminopimelate ligase [Parashewanella curva]|uniref:UDP-N-acetylmuramate--L-alanyl-gamma-D-glutamyl-meso-2,6-diaminoheptandioate ligase n=1 Tax=Parashewanella curva TaxID=2338552 RepID=A0A3L8Q0Y0_9GAMM|nr:UDP-N-acetylmuramate:L-alanyl-gamma-D-glutamyl-meso-diaminopimelate ligase [Parashewanella curva]RLV61337.1 UDP-N-acetylmuramate:L-alanyl-gamma-D-glutamyl-meso-diaminopimelate ligase [Parashewanella curva]
MHVHILGICGTFMGGLALLARAKGHKVTGSDANVYPPMSTQLEEQGIELIQGFDPAQLENDQGETPDLIVIGNAMSRGNPCVEAVLDKGLPYTSGPQFLSDHILPERWVLAIAGTHGKTSTASMLAWILEDNGYQPGFLIGGVPQNFGVSARLGDSVFFVVEADEYDSAFFDKRSKFVHYQPRTLVINNLEFDHADIFDSLGDIQKQFHHVIRTVPSTGKVIWPADIEAVQQVIEKGIWSEQECFHQQPSAKGWYTKSLADDGHQFEVYFDDELQGTLDWALIGQHNIENAINAIAAARHVGAAPIAAIESLTRFEPPKRRLELLDNVRGVSIYDDFAHHPTAIATTLQAMRAKVGKQKVTVVLEPRSNTMKSGVHKSTLGQSLALADKVYLYQSGNVGWSLDDIRQDIDSEIIIKDKVDELVQVICHQAEADEHIVIMSNGGFEGLHGQLIEALQKRGSKA